MEKGTCLQITDDQPKIEAEDEDLEEHLPGMRPKAMSSPDFMKSYKPPYDAERDWPEVNDEDEDGVDGGEVEQSEPVLLEHPGEVKRAGFYDQRRGSSEERFRRRKRFDTDRF